MSNQPPQPENMTHHDAPTPVAGANCITLLTDFGMEDGYVGVMKGVILTLAPRVTFVDIAHKIKAQHIVQAALVLRNVYEYFPPNTVHLTVVDPGVGSRRRALAVKTPNGLFVGPDNGIFTLVYRNEPDHKAFELNRPRFWRPNVSTTFHGRDIFAPVAAHLALGVPIEEVGTPIPDPVQIRMLQPKETEKKIIGKVIYVDNFGNMLTNIGRHLRERMLNHPDLIIKAGGKPIHGISNSYDAVERNQLLAIFGSSGFLEISVNFGSAQRLLQIGLDDSVEVIFK